MKNLQNKILLTAMMSLFSSSVFAVPFNNMAAPWGTPFAVPVAPQMPVFPRTGFQQPTYVNPFSTPNMPQASMPNRAMMPQYMVPRAKYFPAPRAMPQNRMPVRAMPQQRMPVAPQAYPRNRGNNSFPMQGFPNNSMGNMFPSNFGMGNNKMGNNNMPFSMPSGFPAMPVGNNGSSNPMQGWNKGWSNMGNSIPFMPQSTNTKKKKAWGDKRNIWPDFYTTFTDEAWDEMMGGPRKLGRMPGGWRFPYISTPDPVTVSDAITNQFPPIAEEAGNMMDISKWGVFDGK